MPCFRMPNVNKLSRLFPVRWTRWGQTNITFKYMGESYPLIKYRDLS